jgi:hypothetical protein
MIQPPRVVTMQENISLFRERWSDPLLTAPTILLAVMLFVVAPLQASKVFAFQAFEFVFAIVLVVGVFVMSGSRAAVAAMTLALLMAATAGICRLGKPSSLDINLFAGAWLIMGITLACVVAPAVFASGRTTYHHIMGAILLYLTIACTLWRCLHSLYRSYPRHFPDCRWKIVRRLRAT